MKKNIITITALFATIVALAVPRTAQQALELARQKSARMGRTITSEAAASASFRKTASQQEQTAPYYVFNQDKGYIIISGDDRMPALVGYTDSGTFDAEAMPQGLKLYLDQYARVVQSLNESSTILPTTDDIEYPVVEPLLGDMAWEQFTPFCDDCPMLVGKDGQLVHGYAGCASISVAQVMRYHTFPARPVALPGYVTKTLGIEVPAVEASTSDDDVYDWDNMLLQYNEDEQGLLAYNDAQAMAVAKLVKHVGVAEQLDYLPDGTNANEDSEYQAFLAFGYDSSLLQVVERKYFSLATWKQIIHRELLHQRPIVYMGTSDKQVIGHSFVIDGSDGEGLYHVNWGWGGKSNGCFDISILSPNPDYPEYGYHRNAKMVIGITSQNTEGEMPIENEYEDFDYSKLSISITEAEGDTVIYRNDKYNYINQVRVKITNNSEREIAESLPVIAIKYNGNLDDEENLHVDTNVRIPISLNLKPGETYDELIDINAPDEEGDWAFMVFNEIQSQQIAVRFLKVVAVEDPDIHVTFTCNANGPEYNENYKAWVFTTYESTLTMDFKYDNRGGNYRGEDIYVGNSSNQNKNGVLLALAYGETTQKARVTLSQVGSGVDITICTLNPQLPFSTDYSRFIIIRKEKPDGVTDISEDLHNTKLTLKQFKNGRIVITTPDGTYTTSGARTE